jgi:hypothetical protein
MSCNRPTSTIRRVLIAGLRLYAAVCTLLVTASLLILLWAVVWTPGPGEAQHSLSGSERVGVEGPIGQDLRGIRLTYELPSVRAYEPEGSVHGSQPIRSEMGR